jgi:hypothetical protein
MRNPRRVPTAKRTRTGTPRLSRATALTRQLLSEEFDCDQGRPGGELAPFAADTAAWRETPALSVWRRCREPEDVLRLCEGLDGTPHIDSFIEQSDIDRLRRHRADRI